MTNNNGMKTKTIFFLLVLLQSIIVLAAGYTWSSVKENRNEIKDVRQKIGDNQEKVIERLTKIETLVKILTER